MPFAGDHSSRIYFETDGEGYPLLLHHGFSQSIETWRYLGYADALRQQRRLVMIDARGHGRSAKPHEGAAYSLEERVKDVVAVLDALRIPRVDFLGYSMGGWVGFGLAQHAPRRLRALIVGGAHPFADTSWREAFRHVDGADADAFLGAFEATICDRIPGAARPLVLANDLRALAASATDRPSVEAVLERLRVPCLFYAGERDARHDLVRCSAERVAGAVFLSISEAGHVESMMRAQLSLPHICAFLSSLPAVEPHES